MLSLTLYFLIQSLRRALYVEGADILNFLTTEDGRVITTG